MSLSFEEKLKTIYECIEETCNSSVRMFNNEKGHSSRSVGFAAYEERQHKLKEIAENHPDVIEFLCKKGGHNYFKFGGTTIKIISSTRELLGKNVFERNAFEKDDEFESLDPLKRIIYSTDYDLEANEAVVLECHYLEINRNTNQVSKECNILELVKGQGGFVSAVANDDAESKELPPTGLLKKSKDQKKSKGDDLDSSED